MVAMALSRLNGIGKLQMLVHSNSSRFGSGSLAKFQVQPGCVQSCQTCFPVLSLQPRLSIRGYERQRRAVLRRPPRCLCLPRPSLQNSSWHAILGNAAQAAATLT